MKAPSASDMRLAAEWLDVYEDGDRDACERVRDWLRQQADAAEFRAACRDAGVPVTIARKAIAARAST